MVAPIEPRDGPKEETATKLVYNPDPIRVLDTKSPI